MDSHVTFVYARALQILSILTVWESMVNNKNNTTMKHCKLLLFTALFCVSLQVVADDSDYYYYNPVMSMDAPDPTVIKAGDYFYAYSTGVSTWRSKDLINWEYVTYPFNSTPTWNPDKGAGVWAPDINYFDNHYVMYYSLSAWDGHWNCGIGVATANAPGDKFSDKGKLFTSTEIGVENSIDPFYYEEDGNRYLFWGSFAGIYGIQLDKDGLSLEDDVKNVTATKICGFDMEGTMIYKHGDYYYLFGSMGKCCEGIGSTYQLGVARSKNLFGPYLNKAGGTGPLLSVILSKYYESQYILDPKVFTIGPGHCSEIIEDDAGQTWLLYHGYLSNNESIGRVLHLDQVEWDSDGWPYFVLDSPSRVHDKPVINGKPSFTYSDVEYIDLNKELNANQAHLFLYDTGYVPVESTRIEVDCYTYQQNQAGASTSDNVRSIFSSGYRNGYCLSVTTDGKWSYAVGTNSCTTPHEYEKRTTVRTSLSDVTVNGQATSTGWNSYTKWYDRLSLFSGCFSGFSNYPYYGRIYGMKIYEGDKLVHEYVPRVRNEDDLAVFYDKVTDTYVRPSAPHVFTHGAVTGGVHNLTADPATKSSHVYNLEGKRVGGSYKGIVIKDGKKVVQK